MALVALAVTALALAAAGVAGAVPAAPYIAVKECRRKGRKRYRCSKRKGRISQQITTSDPGTPLVTGA